MSYSGTKYGADAPTPPELRPVSERSRIGTGMRDLGQLFSQLGDKLTTFMEYKSELLKSEVRETVKSYTRGSAFAAAGGVLLVFGVLFLEAVIAFALSLLFPFSLLANLALGFLIVAVVDAIAGGVLLYVGKRRFSEAEPVPKKSLDDLRKDKEWLQREVA